MPYTESPHIVRPRAVDTAFLLTLAGIAFGALGTAMRALVEHEAVVQLVRQMLSGTGQPYTDADVLAMVGPFRLVGAIGIALFAGLLVLVAFRMRAGRSWARTLLVLLALLGAVGFLGAVSSGGASLDLIWSLAGEAFSAAAVIYLLRPESAKYFAEHRERR